MALQRKLMTLCLIHRDSRVLLGMKKKGFGEGRWNGFGGKVHPGENIETAAQRELKEEVGLEAPELQRRGVLNFHFENDPVVLEVHLFSSQQFTGQPQESDEMKPRWFSEKEIPFDTMWPDDRHWIPMFLAGKNLKGDFYFKDTNTLLRYELKEV